LIEKFGFNYWRNIVSQRAKVVNGLPSDPENPGWVKGWGVVRNDPWSA
jgi:hypothetical protein